MSERSSRSIHQELLTPSKRQTRSSSVCSDISEADSVTTRATRKSARISTIQQDESKSVANISKSPVRSSTRLSTTTTRTRTSSVSSITSDISEVGSISSRPTRKSTRGVTAVDNDVMLSPDDITSNLQRSTSTSSLTSETSPMKSKRRAAQIAKEKLEECLTPKMSKTPRSNKLLELSKHKDSPYTNARRSRRLSNSSMDDDSEKLDEPLNDDEKVKITTNKYESIDFSSDDEGGIDKSISNKRKSILPSRNELITIEEDEEVDDKIGGKRKSNASRKSSLSNEIIEELTEKEQSEIKSNVKTPNKVDKTPSKQEKSPMKSPQVKSPGIQDGKTIEEKVEGKRNSGLKVTPRNSVSNESKSPQKTPILSSNKSPAKSPQVSKSPAKSPQVSKSPEKQNEEKIENLRKRKSNENIMEKSTEKKKSIGNTDETMEIEEIFLDDTLEKEDEVNTPLKKRNSIHKNISIVNETSLNKSITPGKSSSKLNNSLNKSLNKSPSKAIVKEYEEIDLEEDEEDDEMSSSTEEKNETTNNDIPQQTMEVDSEKDNEEEEIEDESEEAREERIRKRIAEKLRLKLLRKKEKWQKKLKEKKRLRLKEKNKLYFKNKNGKQNNEQTSDSDKNVEKNISKINLNENLKKNEETKKLNGNTNNENNKSGVPPLKEINIEKYLALKEKRRKKWAEKMAKKKLEFKNKRNEEKMALKTERKLIYDSSVQRKNDEKLKKKKKRNKKPKTITENGVQKGKENVLKSNQEPAITLENIVAKIDSQMSNHDGGTVKEDNRGQAKSGRFWKETKQKFSTMVKTPGLRRPHIEKEKLRADIQKNKELTRHILGEQAKAKEEHRLRRVENIRRREENAKKAEIVQVIKNPAKLKRLKKKQLRMIEKRDTLPIIEKRKQQATAAAE